VDAAEVTATQPLLEPRLERVADCVIAVGRPLDIGITPTGRRRLIPITGGRVNGPLLFGKVLPGGADFQRIATPSQAFIEARYVIETDDGEQIYLENVGMRVASPEAVERINQGLLVDPADVYFRTTPRFETAAPRWSWMMESIFIGTGARFPDRVELSFFRVR
jgi:hypothetical protein